MENRNHYYIVVKRQLIEIEHAEVNKIERFDIIDF